MSIAFGGFVKTFFLLFPFPEEYWNTGEIELKHIKTLKLCLIYFRSVVYTEYNSF